VRPGDIGDPVRPERRGESDMPAAGRSQAVTTPGDRVRRRRPV